MSDRLTTAFTIAEASARCGLPESTLRYWEEIGLLPPVHRDPSSGHRRYSETEVQRLETLSNLRAVGMSIEDMRRYLADALEGDAAAARQHELFQAHAERVAAEIEALRVRQTYLELKVQYWRAREIRDAETVARLASQLESVIKGLHS